MVHTPGYRWLNIKKSRFSPHLNSGGGTPLGASVKSAYLELEKSGCKDKHVFILSDGEASDGYPPSVDGIQVHVIGFQTNRSNYQHFADQGGQVIMADDAKTLDETTNDIFKAILKLEAE